MHNALSDSHLPLLGLNQDSPDPAPRAPDPTRDADLAT
jgi:hypothetical protein